MAKFHMMGSRVFVSSEFDGAPIDKLPAGFYLVRHNEERGHFLECMAPFELPKRIYGNAERMAARFLSTFEARPATTGVLPGATMPTWRSWSA